MQSDVNFPLVLCKPTSQIIQPKFNQCKRFVLHPHFPFIYLTISILGSSIIFRLSLIYTLRFVPSISWNDEDSVLKMDNDDYYGSDFEYMLHFHCNFRDSGRYSYGEPLVADDGTNWNLDYLDNQAFDKFCICHLLHSLHSHEHYSLPDILRMDDFGTDVSLRYEREVYQWKKGNVFFKEEVNGKGMEKTDR